jgi:transcriptional regulator with XRE-family HTH domain
VAEAKRLEEVIGENIRRLREGSELSQTELGLEVGNLLGNNWSAQTVSQAEKGKRAFVAAEMVALARIFNCSIPDLYRRRDVGNVIVSDIFVMSRTELLAQTMATTDSKSSHIMAAAVGTLDRSQAATLRAMEELRTVRHEQDLAISLLSHTAAPEKASDDTDADA